MATNSRNLGSLTVDLEARTGRFTDGMSKAERAAKKLEDSNKRQQRELDRLVSKIDPVVGKLGELDRMEQQLAKHRKSGKLDTETYDVLNKKINEQRNALAGSSSAMQKNAKTAGELRFATRGLPAQFTDIAVSLQGGQRPLTVLLQQGGQLKDMFGGILPAIRAMGTYVVGLINPLTIVAAALGTFAIAAYAGADESDKLTKSLAQTGNMSGATTDELIMTARALDNLSGVTQRRAVNALNEIVKSGKFTSDQFTDIAAAAIAMQDSIGQAIDETISQFAKIADDPVEAVTTLNEKYNFLTADIYKQITALVEQGRTVDAQRLAMQTYSDTIQDRAKDVASSLGTIETVWKNIKIAASEGWDAILDIGRQSTIDDKISDVQSQLAAARERAESGRSSKTGGVAAAQAQVANLTIQLSLLESQKIATQQQAKAEADKQKIQNRAISAISSVNKLIDDGRSKAEQQAKAYKDLEKNIQAAAKAGTPFSAEEIDKARAAIKDKFKETKKEASYREDAATRYLDKLREQQSSLQQQSETSDKIGSAQRELIKFNQQIADIKSKSQLTAEQQSLLNNESAIRKQLSINTALEKQIEAQKSLETLEKSREKLVVSLMTKREQALATTKEQVKEIQKLREANLLTSDQSANLTTAANRGAQSDAPQFSGLSPEIGGAAGDLQKISEYKSKLEEYFKDETKLNESQYDEKLKSVEDYLTRKNELEALSAQKTQQIAQASSQAQLSVMSSLASSTADIIATIGDKSSAAYKTMFLISKAAQMAQAIVNTETAATLALAQGGGIAGIPMATIVRATGYASVAAIGATAISGVVGQAHDGIMTVPNSGTWNLEAGERVLPQKTAKTLDNTLSRIDASKSSNSSIVYSPTINVESGANAGTQQAFEQYMKSDRARFLAMVNQEKRNGGALSNYK
ncbi:phage tail length tape measure family protein [Salinicola sp. V024]|uniref:phage tail length tape measure family protein n=1 Tax=Salinicola sp. V024 TaxID=3459609 RepID=UPI004043C979